MKKQISIDLKEYMDLLDRVDHQEAEIERLEKLLEEMQWELESARQP